MMYALRFLASLLITMLVGFSALPAVTPERSRSRDRGGASNVIQLPRLRSDQWRIAQHPAKVKVICMGRRWGKTVMSGAIAIATAAAGGRVAWIVPQYKNGRPLWRFAENAVRGVKGVRANRAERVIEFANGGFLAIYSADSPDSILGEAFHLVIIDEAARVSEEIYYDVIAPTLADYDGDVILISTPKRRNWFWREWVSARQEMETPGGRAAAWTAPTSDNPNPNIRRLFEIMRLKLTENTFRQEWLAEFLADGGDVFRKVRERATAQRQVQAIKTHEYVFGMDLAKYEDFTVIAVWDITTRELVYIDRFNGVDYVMQLDRLKALYDDFKPQRIVIERNIGEMFIEQAIRAGMPVMPFVTTPASKLKIVDDLAFGFEQGHAHIIPDETLILELESFTTTKLPGGGLRYSAPSGMHDDCVIAACLGYYLLGRTPAWESIVA